AGGSVRALLRVYDDKIKRYEVWVVDPGTGLRIAGPLAHQAGVIHAAFSPDGTRVVTASVDTTAAGWDARAGERIAGPLNHQYVVLHAAFSADGTQVVTTNSATAAVWDAVSGKKIGEASVE